jgi:hypothetical protein
MVLARESDAKLVFPAKGHVLARGSDPKLVFSAGIQRRSLKRHWIPAFAGMTI